MSVARGIGAAALAVALAFLLWQSGDHPAPAPAQVAAATAPVAQPAPSTAGHAMVAGDAPSLPGEPPFRDQDLAVTSDAPDAPVVVLRSSSRSGRSLAIELATREPLPEGKRVFANVSVSDALGNTVMDCTWRDVALGGDDARKLDCELPAGTALPLSISGHQLSAPSFIENPQVVAIDRRAH